MFRESFMRHELSHKQSVITLTATPNQIRQTLVPELPHSSSFLLKTKTHHTLFTHTHTNTKPTKIKVTNFNQTYKKLARIGPSRSVEPLDGDRTAVFESPFVDYIGSFLSVLGDHVLRREPWRGSFQLVQAELDEPRKRVLFVFVPILCNIKIPTLTKRTEIYPKRSEIYPKMMMMITET